jgi:pilus assembly protein Flp/PilA
MLAKAAGGLPTHSERGATATEYAIVASMIAVVIVAAVALIGPPLSDFFNAAAAGI